MFEGTARGKKELKRAKQARQQRASGSDCNLAVNRMLTTKSIFRRGSTHSDFDDQR